MKEFSTIDSLIADLTEKIKLNPNDAKHYYERGTAYEIKGQSDDEINDKSNRSKTVYEAYLGQTVCNEKAIADYSEAIRLNKDYADAYLKRALCYKKCGQKDEAIRDYNKLINLDSRYGNGAFNYGFITKVIAVDIS
jgi:tetratricopeptide (TPR) repeat protein